MWEWMKSHPWTFVIAGVIALLAVGCVIYALATHKRRMAERDRGLMVRDGHELRWALRDLPLAVWFDPDLPMSLRVSWELAAAVFERAVGRALFIRGVTAPAALALERLPKGNVAVRAAEASGPLEPDHGTTDIRHDKRNGEILSALVTLPWPLDANLQKHVCIHEIGHVLGLDHDDGRRDSIMYPKLSVRVEPGKLTERDAELLTGLYGPVRPVKS